MSKKQKGSKLITFITVLLFIGAACFYVKTSCPQLLKKAAAYFRKDNSITAVNAQVYDKVVTNMTAEDFDYLCAYKRKSVFTHPLGGECVITSDYGNRKDPFTKTASSHSGIDLASAEGSEILCYSDGEVTSVVYSHPVYGNCVRVSHGDIDTFYGHMSSVCVSVGQRVNSGDCIGVIGSTGRSTGTHLHFEVIRDGISVDPYGYLYEKI